MTCTARATAAFALIVLAGCGYAITPGPSDGPYPRAADAERRLPSDLRGITFDDISSSCKAQGGQVATERLLDRPTIRVVFDPIGPGCYLPAIESLHGYGQIMGELVDSSAMKRFSLAQIKSRARQYVATLAKSVDIWEIGNEVNGEWLSNVRCPAARECAAQAQDVMGKVQAMYAAVTSGGGTPALTLYYQPPATVSPGYEMLAWEQKYVPAAMHRGLKYVLVSYYEPDNNGIRPAPDRWNAIFKQLAADFPNARVGFGEIGLPKPIAAASVHQAERIFGYYQTLAFPDVPRYTRAGFWWNAAEDLVPSTKWPAFFREVRQEL